MPRKFTDFKRMDWRLSILRALDESSDGNSNDSLLTRVLDAFGLGPERDTVVIELAWLDARGFVNTRKVQGVVVATITEPGRAIARGHKSHSEITTPSRRKR